MLGRHRRSITYHMSMTLRILVGCHIFNSAFAERGWGWGWGVGGRWVDGLLYIQWFDPSNIVGEQHVNVTKFKIRSGVLRIQKNMSWHKNTGSEFFETQETLYNGYFPLLSYFWHICTARNMYFPRVEREGKRTLGPVSQSLLEREREKDHSHLHQAEGCDTVEFRRLHHAAGIPVSVTQAKYMPRLSLSLLPSVIAGFTGNQLNCKLLPLG